ncbi:MAG: DUF4350 domain-containing protein, partial [Gemmatimonadaceae bacterium]
MTNANELPAPAQNPAWYSRPGIVLTLLGVLVLASALVTRSTLTGREGDTRLTTTSAEPLGAKLLFELAGKLGFKTERAETADVPDSATSILAVLDPVVQLRKNEVHQILDFVRGGGALLVALGNGTADLSDSLKVEADNTGGVMALPAVPEPTCNRTKNFLGAGLWFGRSGSLFGLRGEAIDSLQGPIFMSIGRADTIRKTTSTPAVVGFKFGRGRVVVASDPDAFRNDAIRDCRNR